MIRDPRIDPIPGDIVQVGRTFLSCESLPIRGRVEYRRSDARSASVFIERDLSQWRTATLGGEILIRAEEVTR